ncbi:MAG: ATP-binding cassette domain-containing protein [Flavonifractor plautii]
MLEIEGVSIRFGDNPEAVSDTTFTVGDGDRLAVVGETGSGKSVLLLAALGLLPASARVTGSIRLNGRELLGCREREFNQIRGKEIAYIPQGSGNGLNPLYTGPPKRGHRCISLYPESAGSVAALLGPWSGAQAACAAAILSALRGAPGY